MAGIYIHIPFCKQACYYCNFHFSTNSSSIDAMINAITKEVQLQKHYLNHQPVETIYFGGGTPSICTVEQIHSIIQSIQQSFTVVDAPEITLEANPDDITEDKLKNWKAIGINRLSIGLQSFDEQDLQWMNRAHTQEQSLLSIALAEQYFDNITVDLIYGSAFLTNEQWLKNINIVVEAGIQHISSYALTVEPKTALHKLITQNKLPDVDANKQAEHFDILVNTLTQVGFEHYEISNFAKPGYRSKHNSSYWKGTHYIGLGPSAHSFNGVSRQWNVANNALYIKSIEQNTVPFEVEILTQEQQLNEYIMTALRTIEGISLNWVQDKFGIDAKESLLKRSKIYVEQSKINTINNHLVLSKTAKFLADGIAADLFV